MFFFLSVIYKLGINNLKFYLFPNATSSTDGELYKAFGKGDFKYKKKNVTPSQWCSRNRINGESFIQQVLNPSYVLHNEASDRDTIISKIHINSAFRDYTLPEETNFSQIITQIYKGVMWVLKKK